MNNRKFYTCCFSGYRPNKLPWKYKEKGIRFNLFKFKLKRIIKLAIKRGYIFFITGMAMGVDLICAEIILKLKKTYKHIELECAIPCANQSDKWDQKTKEKYIFILNSANKVTYVSTNKYYKGCMKIRNEYMINHSNLLIAVFDGKFGGIQQTIEYAKSNNIKIIKP